VIAGPAQPTQLYGAVVRFPKGRREFPLSTPWPTSPGEALPEKPAPLLAGAGGSRPHRSRQLGSVPPSFTGYRNKARCRRRTLETPSTLGVGCNCPGGATKDQAAAIAISEGLGCLPRLAPGEVWRAEPEAAGAGLPSKLKGPPRGLGVRVR